MTSKNLPAIKDASRDEIDWMLETDCDEDGPCGSTCTGSVRVTVTFEHRNIRCSVWVNVTEKGEFFCKWGEKITCDDILGYDCAEGEDECDVETEVLGFVENVDWSALPEHLTENYNGGIEDEAANARYEAADREAYERDPYRYYGVSRRDFC